MNVLVQWILGNEQKNKKSGVLWNAIGGAFNAGQSAILLIFISHKLGIVTAGIVTIAYAIANLFLVMGKYGVRNYQVTDVQERHMFSTYLYNRIIVVSIVMLLSFIYLGFCYCMYDYSVEKIVIILVITILKLIDSVEDVFLGRYQQYGRLDIGAKIMALRLFLSTAIIGLLVLFGCGICVSVLAGIILSVGIDVYCISRTFYVTNTQIVKFDRIEVNKLLKICFPLCLGTTLSVYIGNVPKYMIDAYMNEEVQAIFGYIMMPVFVIMLLNNFIYQPMVKDLGDLWNRGNRKDFNYCVVKQCLIVIGLTIIIMLIGLLIGLPILSLLYDIDLTPYQMEFAILLLGGGFYALAYYLNVPITTIRKQNYIAVGYFVAAVLSLIFGKYFVINQGMLGAAALYLGINVMLVITYIIVLAVGVKGKGRTDKENALVNDIDKNEGVC